MGRKANRGGERVEFVPVSDGNRNDAEPVRLIFTRPTEREKRELMLAAPTDPTDNIAAVAFQDRLVTQFLFSVKNWEGIKNAEEFLEFAETEFYAEAAGFVLEMLTLSEADAKNSKGSSGTTNQTTRAADGLMTQQHPKDAREGAVREA